MSEDQANEILMKLAVTEHNIAIIHLHRNQFNTAETHCQRGLSYARLCEGTEYDNTDLVCRALRVRHDIRAC
jgi:hypothetical protein